ncbi:hypothetical protein [uncultured Dokdonia sp.]|uniref:hypothetical protein n=1 Tax=uncultured Dokdonia sp. TaxID=575653 RepID=UPI002636F743|nr:hypothetical protein [uncultured Dokdonia sp.]
MNISVELTFTPLQDNYEPAITAFIKQLRASGFTVLENPLSTQVYGEYDAVMEMLTKEIKNSFSSIEIGLFQIKIVKTDRSDYVADF